MLTIPDDFFEINTPGDNQRAGVPLGLQSKPLFNSLGIMEQVPKNLIIIDGLETGPEPCPKNLGLYMYNPATGKSMTLPCKSRTCPACGKGWAGNWQNRLGWNEFFNKDDKALTLTSAYDPGYQKFWLALKNFWRNVRDYAQVRPELLNKETGEYRPKLYHKVSPTGVRKWLELKQQKIAPGGEKFRIIRPFRQLEYFGIVEYNQKHTQPHFHFVLRSGYIPQVVIRKCWQKAQKSAGFIEIAFDVRIEKIRDSVKQYFFKYITKLAEGKDELPPPEKWKGRGVRYSKQFFAAPAPLMNSAIALERQTKRGDYSKFYALFSRAVPLGIQKLDVEQLHQSELEVITGNWNPLDDLARAGIPKIFENWITFTPIDRDNPEHIAAINEVKLQNSSLEPRPVP